ncbi:acyl-CoA thioester hydrolase [Antricoccus suffuscus]|uniref:Acyl-CoA thioester hydrolase n=1 Tax=Antricoccus suffuscus TaxID=1629062 RepID=A0A2T1A6W6_9ACTN|nr:thioesterase family protein [Antricoccus suffuscus]PRZ44341.1 acyl-CoA thioester hydrolase [Antricoccus suffuscus]
MPIDVHVSTETFTMPLKVRYYEADQQSVVYHGWYLNYFDEAFMAWLETLEYGYGKMAEDGVDVMLVHSEIDWHGSLRWPNDAEIAASLVAIGNSSITVDYAAIVDGTPVCSARTVYVTVDAKEFTRMPVPEPMRAALGHPAPLRRQRAGR